VREERVVPSRQEAHRRRRVGGGQRGAGEIEQLAPVLVAEAAQRLEGVGEVGDAEPRPLGDVGARRGPEGAEVPVDELGAGGREIERSRLGLRLVERERPRRPERSLGGIEEVRVPADCVEDAARLDVDVAVLPLEMLEGGLHRQRSLLGELANPRHGQERVREVRLVEPGRHVAQRRPEDGIVARGEQVERPSHHRRLHDLSLAERPLERLAPETGHTRPETDVGRGRPLRLEAGEALDGGNHPDLASLEQELPRERRAVQLAQRQNALCHRNYDRRRP